MPKRKKLPKIPDYVDGGNSPKGLVINKSNPLLSLSQTDLTLPEFKILDAYLGRINSHDPEKRTVRFEKGKLEEYLGVSRILKDDLDKRLRNLFQVIEVKDDSKKKGFKLVSLFEEADAELDENGLWQVTLTCTRSAREYIFNVDNIGYFHYRLKSIINLTSRYSYFLYLYLEQNHFRGTWEIELTELKEILNCTAERYNQFKFFNSEILKKCHIEINEKTNRKFTYEPIKKGRKVIKIQFKLTSNEQIEGQMDIYDYPEVVGEIDEMASKREMWEELVKDYHFSPEQVEELSDLISTLPREVLPANKTCPGDIDFDRYHYIRSKVLNIKVRDTKTPIKNKYAYLKKMIQQDMV